MTVPRTAADYPAESVKWLWRNRIPEGFVCMIAGKPGEGKSMLGALISSELSQQGMNVIYSSTENPKKQMTVPRLIAAGAVRDRIDLRRFVLPYDLGRLEETILASQVRLAIFDPIADHLTVSHHSDSIRKVSYPLVEMAERTGCAILLVEHVLRDIGPKMHPLRWVQGSGSGLPSVAQMVFIVGRDPEDEERRLLCPAKTNLLPGDPLSLAFAVDEDDVDDVDTPVGVLRFMSEVKFPTRRLLLVSGDDHDNKPPTKMAAAREWLTNYLKVAPNYRAHAKDLREDAIQHGHTRITMNRAAEDMGIVKSPQGGRYTTWELPQDLIDIIEDDD